MFMCLRFKVWEKAFTQRKLIDIESSWSNQGKCRLQEWDDWRVGSGFSVYAMKKTFLIAFKPPECQAKKTKQGKPRNMGKRNIIFSLSNTTSCEFSIRSTKLSQLWRSYWACRQSNCKKNDQKSTLANCDLKKETCLSCRLSNTVHLCNKEKKDMCKGTSMIFIRLTNTLPYRQHILKGRQ